jgi:hypothetical protein
MTAEGDRTWESCAERARTPLGTPYEVMCPACGDPVMIHSLERGCLMCQLRENPPAVHLDERAIIRKLRTEMSRNPQGF